MTHSYDVIVLGGGTAGSAAARAARLSGARVAMINDGELGGLCILRGCMPSKTMLHAAHLAHASSHSPTDGVRPRGASIDFAAVMANKNAKVARFQRAKIAGIEACKYDVIDARARFTGPDTLEAGGETYRFTRGAVIATGSAPRVPSIPGLNDLPYLTSDSVMDLTERPGSIVTMGTGAIGLEMSQFFARMGTRVTLLSRRRTFEAIDPLLADEMETILADEPDLELIQPVRVARAGRRDPGVELELENGRLVSADRLLLAAGRTALLEDLDLPVADIETRGDGIVCGDDMRTSNPRIFAAGDATGREMILHVAGQEGHVAGLNAAAGEAVETVDRRLDMRVIFTDPPLATLGLTQREAEEQGLEVVTACLRFPETGRAITMDVAHGLCKLVADASRGEILGAQILGPRADDTIHVIAALMLFRGTVTDMLSIPWYHPTLSEVFLSLAREIEEQRS